METKEQIELVRKLNKVEPFMLVEMFFDSEDVEVELTDIGVKVAGGFWSVKTIGEALEEIKYVSKQELGLSSQYVGWVLVYAPFVWVQSNPNDHSENPKFIISFDYAKGFELLEIMN